MQLRISTLSISAIALGLFLATTASADPNPIFLGQGNSGVTNGLTQSPGEYPGVYPGPVPGSRVASMTRIQVNSEEQVATVPSAQGQTRVIELIGVVVYEGPSYADENQGALCQLYVQVWAAGRKNDFRTRVGPGGALHALPPRGGAGAQLSDPDAPEFGRDAGHPARRELPELGPHPRRVAHPRRPARSLGVGRVSRVLGS